MLTPGGAVAIIGIGPRVLRDWYIYEYFEGTYETACTLPVIRRCNGLHGGQRSRID